MEKLHPTKGLNKPKIEEQVEEVSDITWTDIPGLIFFWVLLVVVFLQFFTRYVLNDSLGWTEEVARFLLILVAFIGAITGVRKGTQVALEFFYRFVPAYISKSLLIIVEVVNVLFFSYMAFIGQQLARLTKQNMVSLPIPKSMIYWAVAISFAIMACYSIVWLVHKIKIDSSKLVQEIENKEI